MILDNSKDEVEIRKCYYNSGALQYETSYVNGERHGIEKCYYPSGALWWETLYKKGRQHGIEKGYYESGALLWVTPYVNGKVQGIVKTYNREESSINRLTLCNRGREVLALCCES